MTLYTVIKPIHIFTSIIIPCPIYAVKSKEPEFNGSYTFLTKKRHFFNFFRITVPILLVIFGVIYKQILQSAYYNTHGVIVASVEFAQYNLRIPTSIFCIALTFFKTSEIVSFLNLAGDIDRKFRYLGLAIDYRDARKLSGIGIGFLVFKMLLQHIPFFAYGANWTFITALDYIICQVPLLIIDALLLRWMVYLNILKTQFSSLNRLLKHLKYQQCWMLTDYTKTSKALKGKIFSQHLEYSNVNILKTSSKLYDDLCEQGYKINRAFAWQFLFIIPTLFILIIFASFQVCQMIKNKIDFNAKSLVFDILYFLSFLEMIVPCVLVKEDAERFVDILHSVDMNSDGCSKLDEVINFMILQTYHQKIDFSAYGIFPLDGTLMYSIFGALTTYLVILLQFDL